MRLIDPKTNKKRSLRSEGLIILYFAMNQVLITLDPDLSARNFETA